jgi:hypothetical protein
MALPIGFQKGDQRVAFFFANRLSASFHRTQNLGDCLEGNHDPQISEALFSASFFRKAVEECWDDIPAQVHCSGRKPPPKTIFSAIYVRKNNN